MTKLTPVPALLNQPRVTLTREQFLELVSLCDDTITPQSKFAGMIAAKLREFGVDVEG